MRTPDGTVQPAPVNDQWPIIGQRGAVDEIKAHFRSTRPPSFVVRGMSGVGKTTLTRTVAELAEQAGVAVVAIHGVQSNPAIALAPLLPLLPEDAPADADDGTLYRLLVSQLTNGDTTLVTVDDAHLLDRASAAAVHAIAASRSALLIVNVRSDLAAPEPIHALWKDDLATSIHLSTLQRDDVAALLAQLLGDVDDDVVEQVWQLSEGLPLFLHELVVDALETSTLRSDGSRWVLDKALTGATRVYDVVDRRLGSLSEPHLDTLCGLSLREQLSVSVAESLASPAVLSDLRARGLAHVEVDGNREQVRLAHPLYAHVLNDQMSSQRRSKLLIAIADAIAESGGRRLTDPLIEALCRIDAGQDVNPDELARAAERALALFDYGLAESLATAGFSRGHLGCGLLSYRSLNGQRRHDDADRLHEALLETADSGDERALVHLAAADAMLQQRNDMAAAMRHRNAGLAEDPSDSTRLQLIVHELTSDFLLGDHASAKRTTDGLPPLSQLPSLAAASLMSHLAGVAVMRADFAEVDRRVDELRALEADIGRVGWLDRERSEFSEAVAAAASLQPQLGLELALDAVEAARALSIDGVSIALLGHQYAGWLGGRINEASDAYDQWVELSPYSTDRLNSAAAHCFGALTAFDAGDRAAFDARASLLDEPAILGNVRPVLAVMHSRQAQLDGNLAEALDVLETGAETAVGNDAFHFAALVAREMSLVGAPERAERYLRLICEQAPNEWVAHWWRDQAAGLAASDKDGLIELSSRFSRAGYLLDAAHSAGFAAELTPSPLERFILLTRAQRWLDEGHAVSRIVDAVERPVSAREGEVLLAASRGLSHRQISDLLVISTRTAANHLHRGYQKLGLTRDDLDEAFAEFRPTQP